MAEWIEALSTAIAAVVSLISLLVSVRALRISVKVSQRQNVVDLDEAWREVNLIGDEPITPHVVKAVNTLKLTALLWIHQVVKRSILYQGYWTDYKEVYKSLDKDVEVPKLGKTCRELIPEFVTDVYKQMENYDPALHAKPSLKELT